LGLALGGTGILPVMDTALPCPYSWVELGFVPQPNLQEFGFFNRRLTLINADGDKHRYFDYRDKPALPQSMQIDFLAKKKSTPRSGEGECK
jgi:hypothetical protein